MTDARWEAAAEEALCRDRPLCRHPERLHDERCPAFEWRAVERIATALQSAYDAGLKQHHCHDKGFTYGCGCYDAGHAAGVREERAACAQQVIEFAVPDGWKQDEIVGAEEIIHMIAAALRARETK